MEFDTTSPIWVQLVSEFTRRLVTGQWAAGDRIPGVRELAADLGVNPNTVQRALAELEREGLCRSERTTGRFVTAEPAQLDRLRAELMREATDDFVHRALGLGLRHSQAQHLLEQRWTIHAPDDHDSVGPRPAIGADHE